MKAALAALALLCGLAAHAAGPRAAFVLQESALAGFQFHAGREVWPGLAVGDVLELVREPANPHDARAVRVLWRGHMLGYVPRRENAAVARFMDRGHTLEARIVRLADGRDPWARVRFEILLPLAGEVAR